MELVLIGLLIMSLVVSVMYNLINYDLNKTIKDDLRKVRERQRYYAIELMKRKITLLEAKTIKEKQKINKEIEVYERLINDNRAKENTLYKYTRETLWR